MNLRWLSKKAAIIAFTSNFMCNAKLWLAWNICTKLAAWESQVCDFLCTTIFNHIILVAKESYMLGSYAPNSELYVYKTPPEEAPSGMMQRGKYKVRSLITDDDKNRWLEWTWHLEICKEWWRTIYFYLLYYVCPFSTIEFYYFVCEKIV